MENVIYLLFVCIVAPLVLMLALLEPKSRRTVGFMIIGMFLCVFVAEINGLINNTLGMDIYYITTSITPMKNACTVISGMSVSVFRRNGATRRRNSPPPPPTITTP